ncbi:MAG: VWA domain-containing protein [Bacteroidia bacterium]|nr:VWA domain-containing protein [Bacteroidia bacterium]NNK72768.1 VWA domain-containing protein [Flavobacteriaceae bacterium]
MEATSIFYIILAGAISFFLAFYQYIFRSERSKVNLILSGLRTLTYFTIGLLLINPKFEKASFFVEKPNLVVAIDNSESVKYLNQDENTRNLVGVLRNSTELNERFDIKYYAFGEDVYPADSLSFNSGQSDVNSVFKGLNQVYKNSMAPMILISDGNQTLGRDYEYGADKYQHPIFPVILGDTTTYSDLRIDQLNVNKYAFLKNRFPVEVFMSYSGNASVNTRFVITSGNSVVYSKDIAFSKSNTSQNLNLTLAANSVGVRSYRASLIPLDNERNVVNNNKPFAVEVIDQKTNVAIISTMSHPDLGSLKKAIMSNEQRQVDIVRPADFLRTFNNYQLAILYQPNPGFKGVFDALKGSNRNVFILTGTQTNWSFLNGIQSNYEQEITRQTEDFQPSLNPNYNTFIIDDIDFNSYPPLRTEFGELTFNVPVQPILYKTLNGNLINEPLLLTLENENRREALLVGENIWKWRAQCYLDNQSFAQFDNFIGKLVQYLASDNQKRRLTVDYETFYNGNSNIIISAQFFNKNYEFDNKASLEIILRNSETETTQTIPFVIRQNNFQVDLSGLEPGTYNFTVRTTNGEASQSGSLTILDYNVEQQFLNANANKLTAIANSSEGRSFFSEQVNELTDALIADSRFTTIQKSTKKVVPLIDFKLLLLLIALSLGAEWFIRKYNGLI